MKQRLKQTARAGLAAHAAILALGICLSPAAHATKVQLLSDLKLRELSNNQLSYAGTLKAGSIVEIPDDYTVADSSGRVNLVESLNNWVSSVSHSVSPIDASTINTPAGERSDYFFPIKISGGGSSNNRGGTYYMALRYLAANNAAAIVASSSAASAADFPPPLRSSESAAMAHAATRMEASSPCADGSCSRQAKASDLNAFSAALKQATPNQETRLASAFQMTSQPTILPTAKRRMSPRCANIMDEQGNLGQWGEAIVNVLSEEPYRRSYTADNALGKFCPKFNSLSPERRVQAQVWFWTALAQEESSCNPNSEHAQWFRDRHGNVRRLNPTTGWGLWAMEKSANLRRTRGAACRDIGTVEGQARCSIDILQKVHYDKGRSTSASRGSYWGPIRRGEAQLMPHMRRFVECFK
jgi:hypothetical protein